MAFGERHGRAARPRPSASRAALCLGGGATGFVRPAKTVNTILIYDPGCPSHSYGWHRGCAGGGGHARPPRSLLDRYQRWPRSAVSSPRLARALARADDATVSKWRNAEAVTPRPHERENVRSARARNERGRAVSQPRTDGLAGTEIIHDVRTRAERPRHAAGARCGQDAILTAWPLAAGQQRRRPWRAQALAAAGLRAVGRATQHSLQSHSKRDDEHRRIISTTQHIDHSTSVHV